MAQALCGFQGCRNPIKKDATACWRHLDATVEVEVPSPERARRTAAQVLESDLPEHTRRVPPSAVEEPALAGADLLAADLGVDRPTALALLRAGQRAGARTPADAVERMEAGLDGFAAELERAGVKRSRISRMEVRGLGRRTPTGREQRSADYVHQVLVLDADTEREVVVDPHVAAFAPVRDHQRPVDDQLGSGTTPFGDVPFVCSRVDYVAGAHLWWDEAELV